MSIKSKNIKININKTLIVDDVSIDLNKGEFVGILGPNGSGKTTFLKSIYRVLKPSCGNIQMYDEDLLKMPLKKSAQKMAVVTQESSLGFDFKVEEVVLMGRSPHKKLFESDNETDYDIVYDSLKKVEMENYIGRHFNTLSGGEKQRIFLARALAQKAEILILDEPTNHLDIKYQLQLMNLIKSLNLTVLAVLHDLNMAATYCDKLYLMNNGKVSSYGTPKEVVTKEIIKDVFEVETEIIDHPIYKKPHVIFI